MSKGIESWLRLLHAWWLDCSIVVSDTRQP